MKKPWSGRFSEGTDASVESFTESVSFDTRLWRQDIRGSVAHARMLGKQGVISASEAGRIVKGLEAIGREIEAGRFRFDPKLEDVHMNIEAALIKKIGPAGGKLHTARSRNDQVALDMRLYLRDETNDVVSLIRGVQRALLGLAEKNIQAVMPGYTHLQRAQPVLLAHHLMGYVQMLGRDCERMVDLLKRINVMPLGAGALAGTSIAIDRKYVAKLLGFSSVARNSMDAVSDRDFALEFASAASILMVHLSRLSEELVLWSSEEFAYVEIPDAFATGSSIMPQKKNPDVPELVRGKAGRVFGSLMGLLTLMKGLPMAYNRDMQEDKPLLFDAVDTAKASLSIMKRMLPGLKFNTKRMLDAASGGYSTATDLAEYLVGKGMPFRKAHEVTGKIVAHCIKKGKGLGDLDLKELRAFSKLFDGKALQRVKVEVSVSSRKSEGGTSPTQVRKELKRLKAMLRK